MLTENRAAFYFIIIMAVIALSSCSNLKYLPEGEKLYTGADVKLNTTEKISDEKNIKKEAKSMVRPEPNSKVLGLRIKLWLYNIAGTPKGKGLRHMLKNKLGEPPVLYSTVNAEQIAQLIDVRLFNKGIFRSVTDYKTKESEKKVFVNYLVTVHTPYLLGDITWPSGEDAPSVLIKNISNN